MKASRLGFIICRLFVAAFLFSRLRWLIEEIILICIGVTTFSMSWPSLLASLLSMAFVVLLWFNAGRISQMLDTDDGDNDEHPVDGAQIAAIGLAIVGLYYALAGFSSLFISIYRLLMPHDILSVRSLGFGDPIDSLLCLLSGLALFLFAPRLGIWLENSSQKAVGDHHE